MRTHHFTCSPTGTTGWLSRNASTDFALAGRVPCLHGLSHLELVVAEARHEQHWVDAGTSASASAANITGLVSMTTQARPVREIGAEESLEKCRPLDPDG